jgi:hypothetical protein
MLVWLKVDAGLAQSGRWSGTKWTLVWHKVDIIITSLNVKNVLAMIYMIYNHSLTGFKETFCKFLTHNKDWYVLVFIPNIIFFCNVFIFKEKQRQIHIQKKTYDMYIFCIYNFTQIIFNL